MPRGRGSIQRQTRTSVAAKSSPLNSKGAFMVLGCAIGQIEPRPWVDALAIAVKGDGGGMDLHFVEGNNFNVIIGQPLPKLRDGDDTVATAQRRAFSRRSSAVMMLPFIGPDPVSI
jgi:hypothetical protein